MRKPVAPPVDLGDPDKTPFARFDHGATMFPPNEIYQAAEAVLSGIKTRPFTELMRELIRKGLLSGQYGVLLDSTWFSVLNSFLRYHRSSASDQTRSRSALH